jgi:hypothetical protein
VNLPNVLAGDLRANLGGLSKVPMQVVSGTSEIVVEKLPQPVGDAARRVGGEASKALKGLGGFLGGKKNDE